ncbi:MAG: hypothetical protein HOP29_12660 [Phycisphaerales bacterium]|nr:hypothetical protein [Phycisphaerales bacterium]
MDMIYMMDKMNASAAREDRTTPILLILSIASESVQAVPDRAAGLLF